MYEVRADLEKNRLYIIFRGKLNDVEAGLAADEVLEALEQMRPGFTVVTDLAEAVPVSVEATQHIQRGQQAIAQKGVKKVARVVHNIVGAMQFKRIQEESGLTYEVIRVTSLEEADRVLDEDEG